MTYNETRLNQIKEQLKEIEAHMQTLTDETSNHYKSMSKMYLGLTRQKSIFFSKVNCEKYSTK